jgi:hypothetical protein
VCATVSRTEMLAESPSETKALRRFGVIAIRTGKAPTGIWVTTWLVEVSITATSLEYLAGTKRDWAKAEDAEAKAKIIDSKGRRYVFIVKDTELRPVLEMSSLISEKLRFNSVWTRLYCSGSTRRDTWLWGSLAN